LGPGINPPRIVKKVEPKFSTIARGAGAQGTVVLQLVVDEHGMPTSISVLSPLGFGLDEQAQAAVEQWRFRPATKDGKPVRVLATIEVNFRFLNRFYDAKTERQRTLFNLALNALRTSTDAASKEKALKTIQDLAQQK